MEDVMLDLMYDIPSTPTIEKVKITKEAIHNREKVEIVNKSDKTA